MSDKDNEIEEEEERDIVDHWSHEHPLTLVVTRREDYCYVCERSFSGGEQGYGCSRKKCGYSYIFHQECAGLPRKIRHAVHPQHTLIHEINHKQMDMRCAICRWPIERSCYRCPRAECTIWMHIRCAQHSGVIDAADDEQRRPSHHKHELRLLGKYCSFKCDACGTTRRGKSYICTSDACEYWIHERCASLPHTMKREDHHHSLSLTFHVPPQYLKFGYKCDVCKKYFLPMHMYWIYHCELCSYAVHLKCAFNKSPRPTRRKNDDEKGIMEFPINDVGEEQLGAFVIRQGGAISISPIPHAVTYKFHNHKLKLVSSSPSSSSHGGQNEEENSDDDDDYGQKSELICDGCITPIFQKQRSSSSSSSSDKYDCYMSCSSEYCKYNLHMACFHLPPHLPSLPLHHQPGHDLLLQSSDKLLNLEWDCNVCRFQSNGLFYVCTKCDFKADIKCASMPDTIYHAAHPQHPLKHVKFQRGEISSCDSGCGGYVSFSSDRYECGNCDFMVHVRCAVLPASVENRKWDKHHPLPLTYDANLDHPGDFYCDECEIEMNPKTWMYHCRHCDLSFHPHCFPAASGRFRNIKFGNRYVIAGAHRHALTYQPLTTKRCCDVCGEDNYEWIGFHCAACNFFICFYLCAWYMLQYGGNIEAVD